jgi:hypothetical protein
MPSRTIRVIPLPTRPMSAERLAPFGRLLRRAVEAIPGGPLPSPLLTRFARQSSAPLRIELNAGSLLVVGPATDPMACRAFPGERSFRALRCATGCEVELTAGVWFTTHPNSTPPELDERCLLEVLGSAFECVTAEASERDGQPRLPRLVEHEQP